MSSLTPLTSYRWSPRVAVAILACELTGITAVLVPSTRRVGFGVLAGLTIVFAVVLGRALHQSKVVVCRCFGTQGARVAWKHVGVNIGIALVGLAGLVATAPGVNTDFSTGTAVVAIVGAIVGFISTRVDDVAFALARAPAMAGQR